MEANPTDPVGRSGTPSPAGGQVATPENGVFARALLISVFVIATCGLIYELLAGTIASYLLGDSVTQFSTIIGVYLFAMGVGSWLSRFVLRELVTMFVRIEILVGLVGGLTSPVLFLAFAEVSAFRVILYGWVTLTGILVGLEIPLLMRILEHELPFADLVSRVLSLDYLGALAASLLFPLWLVPRLGLMRSSFLFGVLNLLVAVATCHLFADRLAARRRVTAQAWGALVLLLLGLMSSERLMSFAEQRLYDQPVIYADSSPYQRLVITRKLDEVRLFLDGNLQFSSRDEYRYHEALVHPAMTYFEQPRTNVLVLGGGDGFAVREILRYPSVERVVLVDLDPLMVKVFRDHDELSGLNGFALRDPRVEVVHQDAFIWLDRLDEQFDLVIVDFPDPRNFSLGKLYSTTFYQRLTAALRPGAVVAVQSTSPLHTREAFWCVNKTLKTVGFHTLPYHATVPSFGKWGFILAAAQPLDVAVFQAEAAGRLPQGLKYLAPGLLPGLFLFPPDMGPVDVDENRLNNQAVVEYHERGWKATPPT